MRANLRRQALILTLANGYTRGVGFVMHLLMARLMGPQALGVMEMAHSVIMLAITPVTAGIPSAVSRLTAQRSGTEAQKVLRAGESLVKRMSAILAPALLILSPLLAWLLGDMRTLPAILTSVPDVMLLGLCAVYCGYFYGLEDARTPALNECLEQTVRVGLAVGLLVLLPKQSIAVTAALPGLAESIAGVAVMLMFRRAMPSKEPRLAADASVRREILSLSAPTTLSRLCLTGMRALHAVLLPVCLRRSGLTAEAATAQFGLLNGMAMPLMMLPGIVTSAVCMVATPAVSRQEKQPKLLRRTVRKMTLCAAAIGAAAMAGLFLLADFAAGTLYRTIALAPVIRWLCPLAMVMAVHQVIIGMVTGLGLQRKTLTGTIAGSALTLVLTALLCPMPAWRIFGAVAALMAGHLLRLIWCTAVLWNAVSTSAQKSGEKIKNRG